MNYDSTDYGRKVEPDYDHYSLNFYETYDTGIN